MNEQTTPDPTGRGQLAGAMARVLAEVSTVAKDGRNDFHGYEYATEGALVAHVRSKLAAQGLAIFPSVIGHETAETKNARGKTSRLTTVTMAITIVHTSGQSMATQWIGQGEDAGDKGYYKAYTGAMKYFLMKTFLISTGDDPEATNGQGEQTAPRDDLRELLDAFDELVGEVADPVEAGAFRDTIAPDGQVHRLETSKLRAYCAKLANAAPEARRAMIAKAIGVKGEA